MTTQMTPQQIVEAYFGQLTDRAVLDAFYEDCPEEMAEAALLEYDQPADMAEAVAQNMREWRTGIVDKVLSFVDEHDVIQWGNYAQAYVDSEGLIWTSNQAGDDVGFDYLSADNRESLARWAVSQ